MWRKKGAEVDGAARVPLKNVEEAERNYVQEMIETSFFLMEVIAE